MCGHPPEDFVDENGRLHDPPLYEPVAVVCHGCAEREKLQSALHDGPRLYGHTVALLRFDPDRPVDEQGDLEQVERDMKRFWRDPEDEPSYG